MDYDIKIVGGLIVDGTGRPGVRGDVGIRAGRVVAMGRAEGSAKRLIEADEHVVAPGFVDIHTHYDAQIVWDRMLTVSPWHGVTTVVMGNCGFGVAPTRPAHRELVLRTLEKVEGMSFEALREGLGGDWPFDTFVSYLDMIERNETAINVAALVGHTPIRLYVMGEEAADRPATKVEIEAMCTLLRAAMDAGAIGFATSKAISHVGFGGKPVPSRAASWEEVEALTAVLGELGRGIVQATFGPGLFFDEFASIARRTGRPVTWTALLAGMMGPGSHRGLLAETARLVDQGLAIVPQVSCRPLMIEFQFKEPIVFEALPYFQPISAADRAGKEALYRSPELRAALKETVSSASGSLLARCWERTVISRAPSEPDLEERIVADAARERGMDPTDLALDLALASQLEARFRMAVMNHDEAEVRELITDPNTLIGLSDAGAHASQLCDACASTHLLGYWVREQEALRLEEAVRMLTSRPAQLFGIDDRGRLAVGLPADIVVFDPRTIAAGQLRRVHDQPGGADRLVSDAFGVRSVIVNGVVIRHEGADAIATEGPLPGHLLRYRTGSGSSR